AEDPDDVQPGYGYVPADTAHHEDIFYYHTDHLGSTSYITDAKANVAQFDAYLPYGELLVDEHSSTEEMPYKFNGKELDQETGLYYYGARYMNPRASLWYGIDPLAEKYPSIGGYVYCAGNPVKFIDIQGLDLQKVTVPANKNGTKFKTIEVDSKIAAKVYTFTRAMNKKYGVVVTSAFRSRTKQQQMRANWDKGERAGLKARPAKKSAHSGGFALDFNISAIGLTKVNYKQEGDLIKELTEFGKEYGFEYGAHFKNNPDLVHFYGNETDYGYKSRDEAIEVNDIYKNKHGDNIPLYSPDSSNDTPKKDVAAEQHQKHEQKKSNKE
ncbi:RHS repeat-associated core domain-containing protein, partial [Hoylesella saccharolytica]|uniref:RHS repeat-associated core domain-containing protein n=1 Tax=Hoylesella saccharolytica TaxID=633701 RepID=UPI0028D14FC9